MTLARWTSPRLHAGRRSGERTVGWLELFYDLIFVAALIQVGQSLVADLGWPGVGRFVVLFTLLWWAWTATTLLMNRIDADDLPHRLLMIGQMFAIGILATLVDGAFAENSARFAVAYAVIRFTLALMYARVWQHVPKVRALAAEFMGMYSIVVILWLVSAAVPTPWRFWLWGIAFLIDLIWILTPRVRNLAGKSFPPDQEHMTERFALLTIIVIGESFIKTIGGIADHGVTIDTQVQFTVAFAITAGLWWTYFDDVADSPIRTDLTAPTNPIWVFSHLPLTMGLTAVGVALEKLTLTELGETLASPAARLLVGATVIVLLSVAVLDVVTQSRHFGVSHWSRVNLRVGGSVLLLLVGLMGSGVTATAFGAMIALIVLGQIGIEVVLAKRSDREMRVNVEEAVAAQASEARCDHLADLGSAGPESAGCVECIEEGLVWVHLRYCTTCGNVGCCDDSDGRHAARHYLTEGHRTIRSLEPGETWAWCYEDQVAASTEADA
jgi:low temperature requirement protein LtrA